MGGASKLRKETQSNKGETGFRYSDIVDYSKLDPVKREALKLFESTFKNPERLGIKVMPAGETAAVFDFVNYDFMLAFNVEGLGTKNLIADKLYKELVEKADLGKRINPDKYYIGLGQDTMLMSVIDLVPVGAVPIAYGDIMASGISGYFDDIKRTRSLLRGYQRAANLAGLAIAQGETPTISGVVDPSTLDLAGASIGIIRPKSRFMNGDKIKEGDLLFPLPVESIVANGLSLARKIAEKLPEGYHTKLADGKELGEKLLQPGPVEYVKLVEGIFDAGVDLHYIPVITGHAWRKMARANRPFNYVIENVPEPPLVFKSLIEFGGAHGFNVSDYENYQTWNMGVFMALIAPKSEEEKIGKVLERHKIPLQVLGHVEKGDRKVIIKPKNIVYQE